MPQGAHATTRRGTLPAWTEAFRVTIRKLPSSTMAYPGGRVDIRSRWSRRTPHRAVERVGRLVPALSVTKEIDEAVVYSPWIFQVAIVAAPGNLLIPAIRNALCYLTAKMRRSHQVVLKSYHQAGTVDLAVLFQPVTEQVEPALGSTDRGIRR